MKKIRDLLILILIIVIFVFIALSLHTFVGKYLNDYLVPILFLIAFLLPTIVVMLALREPAKEKAQSVKKEVRQEVPAPTKKVEEKKKTDSKEAGSLLGPLIILLSVLSAGYFFGDDISQFLKSKQSEIQRNDLHEEKWFFIWERSLDPKNRDYRTTSAKLPAEIFVRNEKSLEFEVYYRDRGRDRVAKASGLRILSNGKHYEGTWSQGRPGDTDYDYGTFHLSEINQKKYKGYTTDKEGGKVFVSLEKILP